LEEEKLVREAEEIQKKENIEIEKDKAIAEASKKAVTSTITNA